MSRVTYIYGVFWTAPLGTKMWGLAPSKRQAINHALGVSGEVFRNPYHKHDLWDGPTFRSVGEKIYPISK